MDGEVFLASIDLGVSGEQIAAGVDAFENMSDD